MNWISKKSDLGKERIITKFFWFPMCLPYKDKDVWRWLERSSVLQRICECDVGGSMEWGNFAYKWCNISWSNEEVGYENS